MPRVHTQIARNDIYEEGKQVKDPKTKTGTRLDSSQPANKNDKVIVKKGQTYYWWKFRYGGKRISTTYPKASQLTQSAYLGQLYDIQERMGDIRQAVDHPDDFDGVVDEIKSDLENLKDETQSSLDNMPEQLQSAPTGELLQERVDALESAISEFDGLDFTDYEEDEDAIRAEAIEELQLDEDDEESLQDRETEINDAMERIRQEKRDEWLDEKSEEVGNISLEG